MQLEVRQHGSLAVMDEDGNFRCAHDNVQIEPPCCDGSPDEQNRNTCGCHGQYTLYCPDCRNEDVTDYEVEDLLSSI